MTGEGQGEEQRLDAQRQRDVLHQDGKGGPGQADEAGDLAQVVVHERHVGGLDGGVRAVAGHSETDVGPGQRRGVVDAVARHAHLVSPGFQFLDDGELVRREQTGLEAVHAHLTGDGRCRVLVVTGEHDRGHAQCLQFPDSFQTACLERIGHGEQGPDAVVAHECDHGLALLLQPGDPLVEGCRVPAQRCRKGAVAQIPAPAGHDAADALTGQSGEIVHVPQGDVVFRGGLGDGAGNRMVGTGRQTGRQRAYVRFMFLPRAQAVGLARLAVGEGAGLVQGQAVEASALFQEHAALDEDAVAGGGGHAADDAHRRGDDQGAGAADDQYHQRGIDGVRPGAAQEQGRHQGGQQGHQEDGRGVVAREGIHKALHGGAAALGLFHGMDDAGQRGVRGRGGHPEFKGAGGIEGPGVDRVPGLLFHRHALAGDGRLIHQGTAVQHQTVQGDLFAGAHAHTAAHGHRADVGFLPAAVLTQHRGRIGRQGQQVLDGVAGPVQGLGLDGFRDVEQHHDHGGFRELPDEHGPGDGHGHEGIDVQVEVGDGQPALAVGGQAAQQDGDEGAAQGQERQHGPAAHAPGGHVEAEGTRPPVLDEL